jgi:hypothetical protein
LEFAQGSAGALPAGKRIYFRRDSAAYQAKVINYYSQPGRSFSITADLDAAVKREIQHLPEAAWQLCRTVEGTATDREMAETVTPWNRQDMRSHNCLRPGARARKPRSGKSCPSCIKG